MGPKKRKAKTTIDVESLIDPQDVPDTLQLPYHGPDRLTILPGELRARICSLLHAPGEARWDQKFQLQAVRLVHTKLQSFAREELFRYMKLNFIHTFHGKLDEENGEMKKHLTWHVPKTIRMIEREPRLAPYVRALRVQVTPVPLPAWPSDHDPAIAFPSWRLSGGPSPNLMFFVSLESARSKEIRLFTDDPSAIDSYGYVDDGSAYYHRIRNLDDALANREVEEHPDDLYYTCSLRMNIPYRIDHYDSVDRISFNRSLSLF